MRGMWGVTVVAEGDSNGDASVVGDLEARDLMGGEEQGLGFNDARKIVSGEAGVIGKHGGEVSFGNDVKNPNDWVKPDGPLKRSVGPTHAKPLDEGDEGASEPTGANADVSVECDDV